MVDDTQHPPVTIPEGFPEGVYLAPDDTGVEHVLAVELKTDRIRYVVSEDRPARTADGRPRRVKRGVALPGRRYFGVGGRTDGTDVQTLRRIVRQPERYLQRRYGRCLDCRRRIWSRRALRDGRGGRCEHARRHPPARSASRRSS